MAWEEPVTDWSENDHFSCNDWNRICANINYLYPDAGLRDDYTQNDVLSADEWKQVITILQTLIILTGISKSIPNDKMTAFNMNLLESIILALKGPMDLRFAQEAANIYSGDEIYIAAGPEDYVRGI